MRRRVLMAILTAAVLAGPSFGQAKRLQISLFGGASRVLAYGSEADYAAGINDFPLTPAHTPMTAGLGLGFALTGSLRAEIRGEYALGSDLTLSDPSDGDRVTVPSAKHLSFSLNMVWSPFSGKLAPYLIAGGGADKMMAESASYLSAYGYQITFDSPARSLDFFVGAGAGLQWSVLPSLGVFIEARGRLLFAKPDSIRSLDAVAGVRIRL